MNKLIVLTGPTAVGKTKLSVELAKRINASIISADSMQVYRGMDIGTAKTTREEMQGIRHYGIDIIEPDEEYNVYSFQQMALKAMDEIYSDGKIPMIVGGTGFYIQSVLYDINFTEQPDDPNYRSMLQKYAEENGAEALHERLKEIDDKSAEAIPAGNVKRVIRAMEYHHLTGQKISEHNETEHSRSSPYDFRYFVLNDERQKLYDRINRRVDQMMSDGLVDEVTALYRSGRLQEDSTAGKGIGYREFFPYFRGECGLDEVSYNIKLDTRHFAKRQLTWFRREKNVTWINKPDFGYDDSRMLDFMADSIEDC